MIDDVPVRQRSGPYRELAWDVLRTVPAGAPVTYTGYAEKTGRPAAVRAAAGSDLAVVVAGDRAGLFGRGTSGEGCDTDTLELPGVQREFVEAVLDATDRVGAAASTAELARMREHFTTTSRYEWMFWDGAYRRETWPV